MYREQRKDIRDEYRHNKLENKFGDKLFQGKKEYNPSKRFLNKAEYMRNLKEGDQDYYRRKDTDVLQNIATEDMGLPVDRNDYSRRDYRKAMKYSQSPMDIAKGAIPQYAVGAAALLGGKAGGMMGMLGKGGGSGGMDLGSLGEGFGSRMTEAAPKLLQLPGKIMSLSTNHGRKNPMDAVMMNQALGHLGGIAMETMDDLPKAPGAKAPDFKQNQQEFKQIQQPNTFEMDPNQMTPNPLDTNMTTDNAVDLDTSSQDNLWMNPTGDGGIGESTPTMESGTYGIAKRGRKRIEAEGDEILMRKDKKGRFFMKRTKKSPNGVLIGNSHEEVDPKTGKAGVHMTAEEGDVIFPKAMKGLVLEAYRNNDNLALEDMRSKLPKDTPNGPEQPQMAKHGNKFIMHSKQYPYPTRDITAEIDGYNSLKYQSGTGLVTGTYAGGDYVGNWTGDQTEDYYEIDQSGTNNWEYDNQPQNTIDYTPMQGSSMRDYVDPTKKQEYFRDRLGRDKLYLTGDEASKENEYNVHAFREAIRRGDYNFGDQKVSEADYNQWLKDKKEWAGKNSQLMTRDADEVYDLRSSFLKDMYDKYNTEQRKVYDPEVKLDKPEFYQNTYDPVRDQFATPQPEAEQPADGDPMTSGPGGRRREPFDWEKYGMYGSLAAESIGNLANSPERTMRRFQDPIERQYRDVSAGTRGENRRALAMQNLQGEKLRTSRGQKLGMLSQNAQRYRNMAEKINQYEGQRFDAIDQDNITNRRQIQGINTAEAVRADTADAQNRAKYRDMLRNDRSRMRDLMQINRAEKFIKGREKNLMEMNEKLLAIEAFKYGVTPEQLKTIMGDGYGFDDGYRGPSRKDKTIKSPRTKDTDTDTTPKEKKEPTTKVGKAIDKGKKKVKKEVDKTKKDVKDTFKPRTEEEKISDKLDKRRYKTSKQLKSEKEFNKEQNEKRKIASESEKMIKQGRRKLSKKAEEKRRSDERYERRERKDKLKTLSKEERERQKNLTAEERRDERVKKRKKKLANR
jgi:hypothetical protein